jgi:hypothetical protein
MSAVNLTSVTLGGNLSYQSDVLDVVQDIGPSSVPTFAGLSIRGASGILCATAGNVAPLALSSDLHLNAGVLSAAQSISQEATPTFGGIYLKQIPNAILATGADGHVTPLNLQGLTLTNGTLSTVTPDPGQTLADVSAGVLVKSGGLVSGVSLGSSLSLASGTLDTLQRLDTQGTPRFASVTLGNLNGLLSAAAGTVHAVQLGAGLTLADGVLSAASNSFSIAGCHGLLSAAAGEVRAVRLGAGLTLADNTLNTAQPLDSSASPAFAALTIGSISGLLSANRGQVSHAALGPNLKYAAALDTAQDIQPSSSPTFNALTITRLNLGTSSGLLYRANGAVGNVNIGANLSFQTGMLDTCQPIQPGCSPVFLNLTLSALNNCIIAAGKAGSLAAVGIGAGLIYSGGTLGTVQDIGTNASVRFASLTLGNLGGDGAVAALINGNIAPLSLSPSLTYAAGVLSTAQDLTITGTPRFSALTLNGFSGLLSAVAGVVEQVSCGSSLTLGGTLNTIQDIQQTAHPQFAGLTLGSLHITGYAGLLGAHNSAVLPAGLGTSLTLSASNSTSAGLLDTCQPITRTSNVQFAGVTLGTMQGLICAQNGALGPVTCSNNLTYSAGTLDTVQALGLKSSPTFASVSLTNLTIGTVSGILCADVGQVLRAELGQNLTLSCNVLNTVQNIGPAASPSFTGLSLNSLAAGGLVSSTGGILGLARIGPGLSWASGTLDVAQAIGPSASVQFARVTTETLQVTNLNGILAATGAQVASVTLGPSLQFGQTLDVIQDIRPTAAPTFAGLTLGAISGVLCAVNGVVSNLYFNSNLIFNPVTKILNTCQDLTPQSSPAFTTLTLAGLRVSSLTGVLSAINGSVGLLNIGPSLSLVGNVLDSQQPLGISASPSFAALTIGNLTGVLCANSGQVGVLRTGSGLSYLGGVLSTVQPLDVSASPMFAGVSVGQLSVGNASGLLSAVTGTVQCANYSSSLTFANNTLDTVQAIGPNAAPIFSGLTIGTDTGLLCRAAGAVRQAVCGPNVTFLNGTLDTVQAIGPGAAPTFGGLTIGSLTFGRNSGFLYGNNGAVGNLVPGHNMEIVQNTVGTVQAPTFTALTLGASQLAPAGFSTLPNGMLMQWANVPAGVWVFPRPFTTACVNVQASGAEGFAAVSAVSAVSVMVSAPAYCLALGF